VRRRGIHSRTEPTLSDQQCGRVNWHGLRLAAALVKRLLNGSLDYNDPEAVESAISEEGGPIQRDLPGMERCG